MNKRGIVNVIIVILVILSVIVLSAMFLGIKKDIEEGFLGNDTEQGQETTQQQESGEQGNLTVNLTEVNESEAQENITEIIQIPISTEWCNKTKKETVTSDIFGEGSGDKIYLGVSKTILGNITSNPIICEACHTITEYKDTERTINEWKSEYDDCYKIIASKSYLFTNVTYTINATAPDYDLFFSNKTYTEERWYIDNVQCFVVNGILRTKTCL